MARIGMIGLGWLAVACIASAQSGPCQEDGEAECYSTLDIDPYSGSLTGVSTTEIPYWYLSYGIEAYAEGILANLGGGILADVEAYDDGSGYAEADTSGTATDTGQYYEEGDHWEVEFLGGYQLEIGTTQADQYWTQPCTYPDYEVDSFVGWGGSTGDTMIASYRATVADYTGTSYVNRTVQELGTGGSDSCYAENGYDAPSVVPLPSGAMGTIASDGSYGDYIGYYSYVVFQIIGRVGATGLPCGYVNYQEMQMLCEDGVTWQTFSMNVLSDTVLGTTPPYINVCRASPGEGNLCETQ